MYVNKYRVTSPSFVLCSAPTDTDRNQTKSTIDCTTGTRVCPFGIGCVTLVRQFRAAVHGVKWFVLYLVLPDYFTTVGNASVVKVDCIRITDLTGSQFNFTRLAASSLCTKSVYCSVISHPGSLRANLNLSTREGCFVFGKLIHNLILCPL